MLPFSRLMLFAVLPTTLACAKATAAAPPPGAPVAAAREAPTTSVRYSILRRDPNEVAVLTGKTELGRQSVRAEAHTGPSKAKLELDGRPDVDGTLFVTIHYSESASDIGRDIKWEPSVHLARGAPVSLTLNGEGFARELRLEVM